MSRTDGFIGRAAYILFYGFVGLMLLYLILPSFVIVPLSFSNKTYLAFPPPGWSTMWYERLAQSVDYPLALMNSIKVGIPATILATTFGTAAALGVTRANFPFKRLLGALLIAPLMLPQIIYAIGAYPMMIKLGLAGSYVGVILGHAIISMPLVFITVSASLKSYGPNIELAAMTLGANVWRTFWYVTFPLIRLGIYIGAIFSFSFSFDELIIALFLTDPATRTLPLLLWEDLRFHMTPIIAAATTLVLCFTFLVLAVVAMIQRRAERQLRK
jgi:ABC-type spermidine/putrescine transport system permease subunit II